jgi:predicted dehydrogenase
MGMVGGGEGSFIGPVHRMAAELDGQIELVCGAFSSNADRSRRSGQSLYALPPARCYGDFQEMFELERQLPESERMQFVAVTTPNHVHFDCVRAALSAGFHVVCDKPLTHRLEDALALEQLVQQSQRLFALTHNYTGYPMVREARELIRLGRLGKIRRVVCEYLQGWLADDEETAGNKQAQWRTDPNRAGVAGCFGDIGSHGHNLIEYVTGLEVTAVCADLTSFVAGRRLDDDGNVLLRFDGGARGVLFASQIAVGEENALKLRVYGEQGGLEWSQMAPNSLLIRWLDAPYEVRRTGGAGQSSAAQAATRLPAGHPEGYLESFAVLYRNFALAIRELQAGRSPVLDFPSVADGVRGMQFIDSVVRSSTAGSRWLDVVG